MGADLFESYVGALVSALTLFAYFVGDYVETGHWQLVQSDHGVTMAFLTMSMAEIFQSFNVRTRRSLFVTSHQNKFLWCAAILALLLTTAVIYVPFLSSAFGFTTINLTEYAIALGLAFCIIPLVEISKLIRLLFNRNN